MISIIKIDRWDRELENGTHGKIRRIEAETLENLIDDLAPDVEWVKAEKAGDIHRLKLEGREIFRSNKQVTLAHFILERAKGLYRAAQGVGQQQAKLDKETESSGAASITPVPQIKAAKKETEAKIAQAMSDLEASTGMKASLDVNEYEKSGQIKIGLSLNI